MTNDLNSEIYGMMQEGKPYKSYIKTILGKVYVQVINPFDGKLEGRIVEGNPKRDPESCIVDIWTEKENVYFRRANKRHFETGSVIEYHRREETPKAKAVHEYSDEELKELINSKFLTLQSVVNKLDSVPVLFRMVTLAKEIDKSEKIVKFLEGKLSEVQLAEFKQPEEN